MTAPLAPPDPQQTHVIDHATGPLLVTGSTGTGKSWALRERFARLVESGVDPERVALVVGSAHARDTARAALLARLQTSLPGLQVLTVHGLANRILRDRFSLLGYVEPPEILGAAEQFARVRELLEGQDTANWPAYGHLLGSRAFADEVRQLLLRAEDSMREPDELAAAAEARGLTGWAELARFYREYQDALDDANVVDFSALLQRAAMVAGKDDPAFDHLIVDDYQDATLAQEAMLRAARASSLVVAGDPEAHVFSFQGATRVPFDRFAAESFPGAQVITLGTPHRTKPTITTWSAPHVSEELAAVARELRRLHVEDGINWSQMAVVVRRQGTQVGGLLRALDDARIPRAVPERGLSLGNEAVTFPYVLALRWLVADETARETLVEQLLTSDVVGLSPAAARGLTRAARAHTGSIAGALDEHEGLAPDETDRLTAAREVLAKASLFAGMSVQDAFKVLWEELPCSRALVDAAETSAEARRAVDTVVMFAGVVSETDAGGGDRSVEAFLEGLDAGEQGPGYSPWERAWREAVQVLTAHGAVGREFDAVVVIGAVEGNVPSVARPEPMFDLEVLDHAVSRAERMRERLADERRLFRSVLGRASRRVLLACADSSAPADGTRSRFVEELPDVRWSPAPTGPFDEPVSVREAAAAWRHQLASSDAAPPERLACVEALLALGADPRRWWFQRDWTDTGRPLHEHLRVSYSRLSNLENCELQHLLNDELGLGRPGGYHAWVGKIVHGLIEEIELGKVPRDPALVVQELDRRWRPQEFPSRAVSEAFRKLARDHMLRNWFENYEARPAVAVEQQFSFEFAGAEVVGYIDRIGPAVQDGTAITDFKTGKADHAGRPEENLQLGIYYLAVQDSEALEAYKPVRMLELAFIRGNWRNHAMEFRKWPVTERREETYEQEMRERLTDLIERKRALNEADSVRPNPYANCRFCDFKSLCPLWAEGEPIFAPSKGAAASEQTPEEAVPA